MAPGRALTRSHERAAVLALAGLAALLSAFWVVFYLRGGPRIVDAATYFHEASLLSRGELSIPAGEVPPSITGRFLVTREVAGEIRATPIFPPGWPAALALGFLVGAPLAIGPIVAALLVVVTAALARDLAREAGLGERAGAAGIAAAVASALCAALRYHTADTMSHGWVALASATALLAWVRSRGADARWLALAGLATGWCFASRPVSAIPLVLGLGAYRLWTNGWTTNKHIAWALVGAAAPVALFLAHARAATGSPFGSAQLLYYAQSDGPAGCFRYGFGEGVGCLGEHGDFVRARLWDGYGVVAVAGTTLRRLSLHVADGLNAEPLFALVVLGAWRARGAPLGRALALACVAQVAAYAPFYFDGNYPGGGARLLADVLPLEHALVGVAVAAWLRRPALALGATLALAFAVRARAWHEALRDRDGGRPEVTAAALDPIPSGALLFVEGDSGFSIAAALGRSRGIDVRRWGRDGLDEWAWEAAGRPPAFELPVFGPATPRVPPRWHGRTWVRAARLWPARMQENAWAFPEWESSCSFPGMELRVLRVHAQPGGRIVLPLAHRAGCWETSAEVRTNRPARLAVGDASAEVAGGEGECGHVSLGRTTRAGSVAVDLPLGGELSLHSLSLAPCARGP